MIFELDPFSNLMVHDLKISLIGQTNIVPLEELGITSVEKKVYADGMFTSVIFGSHIFTNCYKDIFNDFQLSKIGFLGVNDKIIGIARHKGEKPFFYSSWCIAWRKKNINWLKYIPSDDLSKIFMCDPGNL